MARILVIEDDPIYREMIVEALTDEGYETLMAENGLEGIERAQAYIPDLVISDVVMEKADGYQVLATLRNEPSTAGIPFIMITGWSSKGGQRQGMAMGADDYLSKPFNATELLDTVSAQLKKKKRSSRKAEKADAAATTGFAMQLPKEIRGPLQTIQGMSGVIAGKYEQLPRKEIGDMARHILAAGNRIQRWIDNVTLYGQLLHLESDESGRTGLRNARTDHVKEVTEVRVLQTAASMDRQEDIELNLIDGAAAIGSDYLDRLIYELIENALKFSSKGSKVQVLCAFSKDRVGLAFVDQGRGMSPEQLADLDAYVQHGRNEYGQQGLGLGLAIARKIADLHGGILSIKSKPGQGTRVSVELPKA